MAAGNTNTKRITSQIFRSHVLRSMLVGGILAMVMLGLILLSGSMYNTVIMGGLILAGLLFVISLIVGLIAGAAAASSFRSDVKRKAAGASVPFDSDTLKPLDGQGMVHLGSEWLVHHYGHRFTAVCRSSVTGIETYNPDGKGKSTWIRLNQKTGAPYGFSVKKNGADIAEALKAWCGQPAAPTQSEMPQPVKAAPGTCTHCLGPNPADAKVCQWCGSRLETPAFEEPAAALRSTPQAAVSAPSPREAVYERRSLPEDARPSGKGTVITIIALTVILLVLLFFMFGM